MEAYTNNYILLKKSFFLVKSQLFAHNFMGYSPQIDDFILVNVCFLF